MMRLKVLLMKPYSQSDEIIPPFGLGYLATAVRKNHDVQILDGIKEKLTLKKFENVLKTENFDIVGIQIFTFHVVIVKDYIDIIKKTLPKAKIILGGPHPSCSPQNIFDFLPQADFAFKGEAEVGLAKLIDLILEEKAVSENLGPVPGLIWRKDRQTEVNPPVFVDDLDQFGMPSWDLLKPDTYPLAPHGGFFKNYPLAPVIITRGCPFACSYGAGYLFSGKKIWQRSVDKVIEEIKVL